MTNDKLTCMCCFKEGNNEEFEISPLDEVACKECLSKGFVEKCAECGSFLLDGDMHDVPGLHVRVCPDCWNGPYRAEEEEKDFSSPRAKAKKPSPCETCQNNSKIENPQMAHYAFYCEAKRVFCMEGQKTCKYYKSEPAKPVEPAKPANGCAGCPGEEGGCMEHPAECGRYDPETGKKVW